MVVSRNVRALRRRGACHLPVRSPIACLLALALIVLSSCTAPTAKSEAEREADRVADQIGNKLSLNHALNVVDRAIGLGTDSIVVLRADGTDADGVVEIKVHVHEFAVGFTEPAVDIDRCYRFTYKVTDQFPRPERLDICPPQQQLPPTTVPPKMPDGLLESLQATLDALAVAGTSDPDSVRAAVEPLTVGSTATVAVAEEGGATGVAVGIPGQCVMGRIIQGTAEAWVVPRVLAQPGETGCDAHAAARGEAKNAPH